MYEVPISIVPGGDLGSALNDAGVPVLDGRGLPTRWSWRPHGVLVLPDVDPTDTGMIAKIGAVLESYVPGEPEPAPPSHEERIATLEAEIASLKGG